MAHNARLRTARDRADVLTVQHPAPAGVHLTDPPNQAHIHNVCNTIATDFLILAHTQIKIRDLSMGPSDEILYNLRIIVVLVRKLDSMPLTSHAQHASLEQAERATSLHLGMRESAMPHVQQHAKDHVVGLTAQDGYYSQVHEKLQAAYEQSHHTDAAGVIASLRNRLPTVAADIERVIFRTQIMISAPAGRSGRVNGTSSAHIDAWKRDHQHELARHPYFEDAARMKSFESSINSHRQQPPDRRNAREQSAAAILPVMQSLLTNVRALYTAIQHA